MAKEFKKYFVMKPEVSKIFDDLEQYKKFCVEFGYPYNEAHLGDDHSPYYDFKRWQNGKNPRDNWTWTIKQMNRKDAGNRNA